MISSHRRTRIRRWWSPVALVPLVAVAALLGGCAPPPGLSVRVVASGLTIPWDLTFSPGGSMLFTERAGAISIRYPDGRVERVSADLSDLYASGETGLMGIVADPQLQSNRRVYTCQGHRSSTGNDVRVVAWTMSTDGRTLTRTASPLVTGLPITTGRHGGCRLRIDRAGHLWIGTGDAAVGTNPQNLDSLGGKVLRVDRFTGAGVAANPYASSPSATRRRILSFGHRNLQGLALHPDGSMWTVEHGSDRDDEINRGIAGNFGWDPVPGYNEATPMTDTAKFPSAVRASYATGFPTTAMSGATWLSGSAWKGWDGTLAVANLKDTSLRIFRRDGDRLVPLATALDGTYGRLRTAQLGLNGRLYVTTSNGSGNDVILEVTPG